MFRLAVLLRTGIGQKLGEQAAVERRVVARWQAIKMTDARGEPAHRNAAGAQHHLAGTMTIDQIIGQCLARGGIRSEEHTSELQSLMRISYAVFCLKKNNTHSQPSTHIT